MAMIKKRYSMKLKLLFACLLSVQFLSAQQHDNIWIFGKSIFDFSSGELVITDNQDIEMDMADANTSFSDKDGNLLYYTNGIYIEDHSFNIMENGTDLHEWSSIGLTIPQGVLALPMPENEQQSILLNVEKGYIPGWSLEVIGLYYSIIDHNGNNGLGEVIEKLEPLIIDTLEYGKLTATKHANGRDWWIVINESHTNRFYKILLDDTGINIYNTQIVGMPNTEGAGQAKFSPDGSNFVMYSNINQTIGQFVEIYDFDRCTGDLSNHRRIHYNENAQSGGIAISLNSRYLYMSAYERIYQFDLFSNDIESTRETVAIYDGYTSPLPTRFYLAQLAPDGKIYLNYTNSDNSLHVIHNPNEQGMSCNVEQHGIELPPTNNNISLPSYPNYRLGALAGSACDSLTTSIIESFVPNDEIILFPNPIQDYVNIKFEERPSDNVDFLLYNYLGKKIIHQTLEVKEEHLIDLSKNENGVYFYSLVLKDKIIKNGKLVILND